MRTLIEIWSFAIAWYNLPFTLALAAFLGVTVLQFIGLDQDYEAEADLDFELDSDLDLDGEPDFEPDLDHDIEHDGLAAASGAELLQFLGVGRVPVTMILLLLLSNFGLTGWITNSLILNILSDYVPWTLAPVLLIALVVSLGVTSRTSRFIGRALPAFSSTATPLPQLVSRRGRVTSAQLDESYGQVKVRDPGGTLISVFAIVDPGQPPLPSETEVFLVEYDPAKKVFIVEPVER